MKKILNVVLVLVVLAGSLFLINKKMDSIERYEKEKEKSFGLNVKLLKAVNNNSNSLISPYSIEIALFMVKSGATGLTHKEIDAVVPYRSIKTFDVKDRISVANALFISNKYSKDIKKTFINDIKETYDGEVIYDDFTSPDVINNWVDKKTNHMIEKILDSINPDFMLGLANALAIDVEWDHQFECNKTRKEKFITSEGKIDVEGMHNTYSDIEYIYTDDVEGAILPYKTYKDSKGNDVNLEFIAILPKKDLNEYINELTDESLQEVIDSKKSLKKNERIRLMLPRFTYDYEIENFIDILKSFGIKKAFEPGAEFKNITDINSYFDEAIHKTHISLNEKGTKAAAVTYFGLKAATAMKDENKYIDIVFNRPFMYIIKDKDSNELLFMGTVYTPNKWHGNTCESEE